MVPNETIYKILHKAKVSAEEIGDGDIVTEKFDKFCEMVREKASQEDYPNIEANLQKTSVSLDKIYNNPDSLENFKAGYVSFYYNKEKNMEPAVDLSKHKDFIKKYILNEPNNNEEFLRKYKNPQNGYEVDPNERRRSNIVAPHKHKRNAKNEVSI